MIGCYTKFLAGRQVVIHCFFKANSQLANTLTMEAHDISNARDMPDKATIVFTVLYAGSVTPMSHCIHGFTPTEIRNSRASRT
jgi:hypothetical protein